MNLFDYAAKIEKAALTVSILKSGKLLSCLINSKTYFLDDSRGESDHG